MKRKPRPFRPVTASSLSSSSSSRRCVEDTVEVSQKANWLTDCTMSYTHDWLISHEIRLFLMHTGTGRRLSLSLLTLSQFGMDIFCCHSRSQSVPLVYEFDFNTRTGSRNSGLSTNLYDSMNIGAKIGNHLNNKHEWSHFPLTGATKADESWEINIGRKDTTLIDHMRWVSHYKFFNFVVWIWTIATTWSQLFNILIQNKASWGALRPLR